MIGAASARFDPQPGSKAKPDWNREGRDWPNRESSRFVHAAGMQWHVQVMGSGPLLLLLHGAGAATHSWRHLAPLLARDFTLVAPDLPGHGFTDMPRTDGLSLNGMARGLGALLDRLGMRPAMALGHSAGAAIAIQMSLAGRIGPGGVVSVNGALRPFPGAAGHVFPAIAQLLFLNPLAIHAFAWRARGPGQVAKLLRGTGSVIDPLGLDCYARLLGNPGHIAGALGMMAHWNLAPLVDTLPTLAQPLTLVAADNDKAVPPGVAQAVQKTVPGSRLAVLAGLGHLAHEEAPGRVAEIVRQAAARVSGGLPASVDRI